VVQYSTVQYNTVHIYTQTIHRTTLILSTLSYMLGLLLRHPGRTSSCIVYVMKAYKGRRDMAPIILTSVETDMNGQCHAAVNEPKSRICGPSPQARVNDSLHQFTLKMEAGIIFEPLIPIYQTARQFTQSVVCFCLPCVNT
jgi:hypothetical protein